MTQVRKPQPSPMPVAELPAAPAGRTLSARGAKPSHAVMSEAERAGWLESRELQPPS